MPQTGSVPRTNKQWQINNKTKNMESNLTIILTISNTVLRNVTKLLRTEN